MRIDDDKGGHMWKNLNTLESNGIIKDSDDDDELDDTLTMRSWKMMEKEERVFFGCDDDDNVKKRK